MFQNIKVGGGKKIEIKITKKFFLFNLKHIWNGGKKITKIVLFYTLNFFLCKNGNILSLFFLNLAVFYIGGNKKKSKIFLFFSKMQKFGSEDP